MPVSCSKCGEELMGSVNRCWRCGTTYVSRPGRSDLPPVRRSPVTLQLEPAAAEVLETEPEEAVATLSRPEECTITVTVTGHPFEGRSVRYGSPFAAKNGNGSATAPTRSSVIASDAPLLPQYSRNNGALAGAALSNVLGLIGIGFAFVLPIAATATAAVGVVMGIWGLQSRRRIAAIIGLLICCFALTTGLGMTVIGLYRYLYPGAL